jgi:hypothetical protein
MTEAPSAAQGSESPQSTPKALHKAKRKAKKRTSKPKVHKDTPAKATLAEEYERLQHDDLLAMAPLSDRAGFRRSVSADYLPTTDTQTRYTGSVGPRVVDDIALTSSSSAADLYQWDSVGSLLSTSRTPRKVATPTELPPLGLDGRPMSSSDRIRPDLSTADAAALRSISRSSMSGTAPLQPIRPSKAVVTLSLPDSMAVSLLTSAPEPLSRPSPLGKEDHIPRTLKPLGSSTETQPAVPVAFGILGEHITGLPRFGSKKPSEDSMRSLVDGLGDMTRSLEAVTELMQPQPPNAPVAKTDTSPPKPKPTPTGICRCA